MKPIRNFLNIAFLSTYPPRECGIATFTQDLVRELKKKQNIKSKIIAITDGDYLYNDDVIFELPQWDKKSYKEAADRINRSSTQVLVVEHEYGIYGGECGEYILDLVNSVNKPVVTTLHTVLPDPSKKQKAILKSLCQRSEKIVTMASSSIEILRDVYEVDPDKIEMIHHGVPVFDMPSRENLKKQMHLEGRTIVSTFGLISPGKGLEYGIEAISRVARKHPDILYLILGQTHPVIKRQYGETYRKSLEKIVTEENLYKNVQFVNKYLTKEEIIRYLTLSDIYLTPYLSKDQAVSGTLAYAVGYGKAIVSTPYIYAKEMLSDGRGMLSEFKDAISLSDCINFLIEHPDGKRKMEQKTLKFGKSMMWNNVADRYTSTFLKAFHQYKDRRNETNEELCL